MSEPAAAAGREKPAALKGALKSPGRTARRRRGAIVTAAAALSFAAFSAALYLDINAGQSAGNREPVGTLIVKRRVAQRRLGDRVVWAPIDREEPVYSMDAIRTEAGSEAVIRLNDRTELFMAENTLIVLDFSSGSGAVEFLEGSIIARRTEGASLLALKADGVELSLAAGTADLSRADGRALVMGVSEGSATVRVGGGPPAAASPVLMIVDGRASAPPPSPSPLSPGPGSLALGLGEEVGVRFSWDPAGLAGPFTLEASRSRDFIAREALDTDAAEAELSLGGGTWYWRVRDASGNSSRAVAFRIIADRRPALLSPDPGAAIGYRGAASAVGLSWSPSEEATGYDYELSSDAAFSAPAGGGMAGAAGVSLRGLPDGIYYWRARARYDFGGGAVGAWSEPRSFSIARGVEPAAPRLVSPADGAAFVTPRGGGAVGSLFAWEPAPGATRSELAIWPRGAERGAAPSWSGKGSFVRLDFASAPGEYLWSVRGVEADGSVSAWSEPRGLSLVPREPPEPASPADGHIVESDGSVELSFLWRGAPDARAALFGDRALASQIASADGVGGRAIIRLPGPGLYYWAVADGPGAPFGPPRSILVRPPLPAPTISSPARGSTITLRSGEELRLGWASIEGASGYRVSLRDDAGALRFDALTETAGIAVKAEALGPGRYSWSVRAVEGAEGGSQRVGPAASSSFAVGAVRIPAAPGLSSPRDGATIEGLSARRSGIRFAWRHEEPGVSFSFRLERGGGELVAERQLDRTPELTLPDPGPGEYRWIVSGRAADGAALPPASATFTVSAVPPLAVPTLREPRAGAAVDMTEADRLRFAWSRVGEANAYELALSTRDGRPVFSRILGDLSEYAFTELERLDVGAYVVSLRALTRDAAGAVMRSSPPRSVSFSLSVRTGGRPTLLSPKELYVQDP